VFANPRKNPNQVGSRWHALGRPATRIRWFTLSALLLLSACALTAPAPLTTTQHLDRLLPADGLLLGEQHDASDHQRVQLEVVRTLAGRGQLGALLIEMAEQGRSTQSLPPNATESQVQAALGWQDAGWPWAAYGPTLMAAVRSGVTVKGANLPRAAMRESMRMSDLDGLLSGPALKAQQQAIRIGHCDLLPESQIGPMTRIQIGRDVAMAQSLVRAIQKDKVVVLLAGFGHVDKQLGIPQHLPSTLVVKAVRLGADASPSNARQTDSTSRSSSSFDYAWPAQPAQEKDHCAALRQQLKPAS
jgi:uncharacterized iron-regulated protein